MTNNGYQIIDLKGKVLETDLVVPGLYDKLESLEKMPIFVNLAFKNDDTITECRPFTSHVTPFGSDFSFKCAEITDGSGANGVFVTVNDSDIVTLSIISY